MVRRKMTTYVDEELLRSAKVLAARRGGKVYEVFEEALRRYLEEATADAGLEKKTSLAEALSERREEGDRRLPGVPREKAVTLSEGETLSEAVLAERESRGY